MPSPPPAALSPELTAFFAEVADEGQGGPGFSRLLPATHADPEGFASLLHVQAARRPGGLKSRHGKSYDLYHDALLAQIGSGQRALAFAGEAGVGACDHEELHRRASALALAWKERGVGPGQSVALVLSPSVDFAAALFAALRLGAQVSVLAPLGPTFVHNRLPRLSPEHVVCDKRHQHWLGPMAEKLLPLHAGRGGESLPSHVCAPGEPVLKLLSPFGDPVGAPVELTAAAVTTAMLRDGLLVFGLRPGDTLAWVEEDTHLVEPLLMLSVLSAGAALAIASLADIDADGRTLDRLGVTVLGVTPGLRDRVLRGEVVWPRSARVWFKSLGGLEDAALWEAFAKSRAVRGTPGFGVLCSAAAGGVHLFSLPGPHQLPARVWPAPGRAFQLAELAAEALPALASTGVYAPLRDGEPDFSGLPRVVLSAQSDAYLLAGTIDKGREGQSYPAAEVARLLEQKPGVLHAAVLVLPGRDGAWDAIVVLVFTEDERDAEGRMSLSVLPDRVSAWVSEAMGARFAPDRVEVFPLRPRCVGGHADPAWCQAQYLGGLLHRKARSELFVQLSRLGYILASLPPSE